MAHDFKSDRWAGYAALFCAAIATLFPFIFNGTSFVIYLTYCIGPIGLYLAVRGVFIGPMPSRVCAGIAFFIIAWFFVFCIVPRIQT